MRFAVERVEPALDANGNPDGHGEGQRWTASYIVGGRWLDSSKGFNIREGEFVFVKGNFKKVPVEGTEENFTVKTKKDDPSKSINFKYSWPDGNEAWVKVIERAQDQSRGGNPYNGGGSHSASATAHRATESASRPAQAPRVVPTVTEAGAALIGLYDRMLSAVKAVHAKAGVDSDPARVAQAMATTLYIDLRSDRIRSDPTQAQLAAEAEAQAAAVKAEEERLERELEAAREKLRRAAPAAAAAGYEPADQPQLGSDDIPFGFLLALGSALHFGSQFIA
jgi:hypothetical protein